MTTSPLLTSRPRAGTIRAKSARDPYRPGTLREAVAEVSRRALASGALVPIPTAGEHLDDGGVRFSVRVLAALARKDEERKERAREAAAGKPANPFLPYEERLLVADVSAGHVALLNKFNVVDRHLLIVTRAFEDQRALLTPEDFAAWWRCLAEYPALGFYNGGVEAGASQPHKHLQLVPLPLAPGGSPVPVEPLLAAAGRGGVGVVPGFDFLHAFERLGLANAPAEEAAGEACERYRALLAAVGIREVGAGGARMQSGPYCLLGTREWLLVVPRSREFFGPVSVNSLGYAGSFFVRDAAQLRLLREAGPLAVLRETALPARR